MTKHSVRAVSIALLLSGLAFGAGCGGGEEKPAAETPPAPAVAPAPEPAPTPEPAAAAAPAATDGAAAAAGSPFACVAGDAARGKVKYALLCASCHGAAGAGDGPASAALNPKPAHHNDGAYMNALSNEHLVKVITQGGAAVGKSPMMAPWGGALRPNDVLDVVAFVRSLAEPAYACP